MRRLHDSPMLVGGLAAYAVQITNASIVFMSRRSLTYRPNIEALRDYTSVYSGAELRRWVADEQVYAVGFNQALLLWKGKLAFRVMAGLYVEAAFLSLSAFLSVV